MMAVAKELKVACATKHGSRLPVRRKRKHRIIASIRRVGKSTGSRCSRAKSTEDASAEVTKITLPQGITALSLLFALVENQLPSRQRPLKTTPLKTSSSTAGPNTK